MRINRNPQAIPADFIKREEEKNEKEENQKTVFCFCTFIITGKYEEKKWENVKSV